MSKPITFKPGNRIRLADVETAPDSGIDRKPARERVKSNAKAAAELAYRLYAENLNSLLIVLQGIDTSGKDGTIRNVMHGVNPQSCQVVSFKQPSSEELDHDFLWRIHLQVPRRGNIGIFNRSHFEDVLVVRVHGLVPEEEWRSRYEKINAF
jgi:polyphosphate kinase 2 (PPK2 family)